MKKLEEIENTSLEELMAIADSSERKLPEGARERRRKFRKAETYSSKTKLQKRRLKISGMGWKTSSTIRDT